MNKTDFAIELARKTNMPFAKALEVTNVMVNIISQKLNEKEEIRFNGFGTFRVRYSPERPARNPRAMEPANVPGRYRITFKSHRTLLSSINGE